MRQQEEVVLSLSPLSVQVLPNDAMKENAARYRAHDLSFFPSAAL
jgi:hypothetical protein